MLVFLEITVKVKKCVRVLVMGASASISCIV